MSEDLSNDPELLALMHKKFADAERRLYDSLHDEIFSDTTYECEYIPPGFIESNFPTVRKVYFWLRKRLVGTWNVWAYGNCRQCENEYDW